jgi:hypothetical protein
MGYTPEFKKGEFNFVRAWTELAKPELIALSSKVVDLLIQTDELAADLSQLPNLSMPWPPGLRDGFEALSDLELAQAARVIYCYGHWGSGKDVAPLQSKGTYWKFSRYADQVLCKRLDVSANHKNENGISFDITQGCLRVCAEGRDFWTWREISFATTEAAAKARELVQETMKGFPKPRQRTAHYDACEDLLGKCKRLLASDDGSAAWLNAGETYRQA